MWEEREQNHHQSNRSANHKVPTLVIIFERTDKDVVDIVLHPNTLVHGEAMVSKDVKESCVEVLADKNCNCTVDMIVNQVFRVTFLAYKVKNFLEQPVDKSDVKCKEQRNIVLKGV